jgi:D-alanyl-D-alanine carboxypeptidase (penicillin-binding protein 5/6)
MMRGQAIAAALLLGWLAVAPAAPPAPAAAAPAAPATSVSASQLIPPPPPVAAKAHILIDFHTGQVLSEQAPDTRLEPASLTKIMTAYVAFDALKNGKIRMSDQVLVSERAWKMGGSQMFIEVGKQVSADDLLKGVIIQSGNDASVAIAEHIAGSEEAFAGLMNKHAERLGLKNTHFTNASGLPDPNHYTSARDLAILGAALVRDFPEYYPMHSMREFTFNNIVQQNRNRLLWQEAGVDGIKTGHTAAAGYCLVVSGERDNMRLVAVLMGAESEKARTAEAKKLLGYGFRFYEGQKLHQANVPMAKTRVWKGESTELDVGVDSDLLVTVPRGQAGKVGVTVDINPTIVAPVNKGERVGTVKVRLGNKDLEERPLVALQTVGQGGFIRRWLDGARLWWH